MLKMSKKNRIITVFFSLLFTFISLQAVAANYDFDEAIQQGLKNNGEVRQSREKVESLKRQLASLKAGLNWQFDLEGLQAYQKGPSYRALSSKENPINPQEEGGLINYSLKGKKIFYEYGLSLNTTLSLNDIGPFAMEDIKDSAQFDLSLHKDLYPFVVSDTELQIERLENEIRVAEMNYQQSRKSKMIEWMEDYLNLVLTSSHLRIMEERLSLTRGRYNMIQKQRKINEAGKDELLAAEISLKEVELSYRELTNNLEYQKKMLQTELGIGDKDHIAVTSLPVYLNYLQERLSDSISEDEFLIHLSQNDPALVSLRLEHGVLKEELKQKQDDRGIKLSALGSYNYDNHLEEADWQVGLNLSYNLFDSGENELDIEDVRARLKSNEETYNQRYEQLKIQLDSLLKQAELSALKVEAAELGQERSKQEFKLALTQHKQGLINDQVLREKEIALKEKELAYQESLARQLISRLKVLQFVGLL